MDAWEPGAFGNDTACDWLAELVETSDLAMIKDAFDTVLGAGDESVEMQAGEEAIAAADVVAWIYGRAGTADDSGDRIEEWINEYELEVSEALVKKARRVVDRVFNSPSELREAWEESDEFDSWREALTGLKDRLSV